MNRSARVSVSSAGIRRKTFSEDMPALPLARCEPYEQPRHTDPWAARGSVDRSLWPSAGRNAQGGLKTALYIRVDGYFAGGAFLTALSQCSWTMPLSTRTMSNQYAG